MRMSHLAMLGAALVCATAAALLSRAWLVRQSARAPVQVEAAASTSSTIVVAARDVKYGDKLTDESIRLVSVPNAAAPKGAFNSKEALFGGQKSRTALQSMGEGEPILEHKLLGGTYAGALSAKLNENMKAVTIRVNDVAGLAGLVQPDDRVDVFLTYTEEKGREAAPAASSVVVLLQNIRVLAVDQVTQRKDQPTAAKAVTLEVTTEEAQKLVLGGRAGDLSLALNRIAATDEREVTGTISLDDLTDAENRASRRAPGGPVVTVTRSTDRKDYQVQTDKKRDENWQHEVLSHQGGRAKPLQ